MIFYKVLYHDLRFGLIQKKYMFGIIITLTCLCSFVLSEINLQLDGTWMDMMLYLFRGCSPVPSGERVPLPLFWLILLSGCLILNLEYPLCDMTQNGLQIICRYHSRKLWYLSKCIWNLCSTFLYFVCVIFVTSTLCLILGLRFSMNISTGWQPYLFPNLDVSDLRGSSILISGLFLPFLTLAALSLLQMALCLYIRPILGFSICLGIIVLVVYSNSPWMLGTGAMTIRTITSNCQGTMILITMVVIVICIIGGMLRFSQIDILPGDE